ncbi:MAG TPA: CHAD domain-containing protein [Terriglobales bacterium]|nr:CHAD domain-containing protein [Terriglobales bacterium]
MAARRKIEVETKYGVKSPGGADRYLVAPELGPFTPDGPVRSVRVQDRYIDSTDWALAGAGFAARLRKTSHGTRINLKALSSSGSRLQRRQEIEGPADESLVPGDWPSSKARSSVLELCGEAALVDLLTIRQLRRVRQLRAGNTRAELSVDAVEVVGGGRVLDRFEELEVELKGGNEAPLAALADLLDRNDDLRPISRSKLERAIETVRAALPSMPEGVRERWRAAPPELLTGKPVAAGASAAGIAAGTVPTAEVEAEVEPHVEPGDPAPEAAPETELIAKPGTRRLGIRADDSMSEAALKVLRFNLGRMQKREAGTRSGLDTEDLHDMRVAARRMRAAWRVFEGAFKTGKTKKLRGRLESISDRLGAARDLDVLTEGLAAYREALDEAQRPGLEPLESLWRHQRDAARAELVRELDSDRYESFVRETSAFLDAGADAAADATTPTAPHRVRDRAPSEIWATYEAVRAYELVLPWADIETLHRLRIAAKWLRYALEFFGEALGPGSSILLEKVAALQDHLGCLHDADVAAKLARDVLVARAGQLSKVERYAIGTYLRTREREVARRRRSLGPVWRAVNGASFRHALGRATAAL